MRERNLGPGARPESAAKALLSDDNASVNGQFSSRAKEIQVAAESIDALVVSIETMLERQRKMMSDERVGEFLLENELWEATAVLLAMVREKASMMGEAGEQIEVAEMRLARDEPGAEGAPREARTGAGRKAGSPGSVDAKRDRQIGGCDAVISPTCIDRLEDCQRASAELIGLLTVATEGTPDRAHSNGMMGIGRIAKVISDHVDALHVEQMQKLNN